MKFQSLVTLTALLGIVACSDDAQQQAPRNTATEPKVETQTYGGGGGANQVPAGTTNLTPLNHMTQVASRYKVAISSKDGGSVITIVNSPDNILQCQLSGVQPLVLSGFAPSESLPVALQTSEAQVTAASGSGTGTTSDPSLLGTLIQLGIGIITNAVSKVNAPSMSLSAIKTTTMPKPLRVVIDPASAAVNLKTSMMVRVANGQRSTDTSGICTVGPNSQVFVNIDQWTVTGLYGDSQATPATMKFLVGATGAQVTNTSNQGLCNFAAGSQIAVQLKDPIEKPATLSTYLLGEQGITLPGGTLHVAMSDSAITSATACANLADGYVNGTLTLVP